MIFQDLPGPGSFKKNIQDFPGDVGTLLKGFIGLWILGFFGRAVLDNVKLLDTDLDNLILAAYFMKTCNWIYIRVGFLATVGLPA